MKIGSLHHSGRKDRKTQKEGSYVSYASAIFLEKRVSFIVFLQRTFLNEMSKFLIISHIFSTSGSVSGSSLFNL